MIEEPEPFHDGGDGREDVPYRAVAGSAGGVEIVCGGRLVDNGGYFIGPTSSYLGNDGDEIALDNDPIYGLFASVFTTDLKGGLRAARHL